MRLIILYAFLRISIHALREEGDGICSGGVKFMNISIHALREEGDMNGAPEMVQGTAFLSTPSARRATCMSFCAPLSC